MTSKAQSQRLKRQKRDLDVLFKLNRLIERKIGPHALAREVDEQIVIWRDEFHLTFKKIGTKYGFTLERARQRYLRGLRRRAMHERKAGL